MYTLRSNRNFLSALVVAWLTLPLVSTAHNNEHPHSHEDAANMGAINALNGCLNDAINTQHTLPAPQTSAVLNICQALYNDYLMTLPSNMQDTAATQIQQHIEAKLAN